MSAAVWGYPYILNYDNLQRYVLPINKGRENNKPSKRTVTQKALAQQDSINSMF